MTGYTCKDCGYAWNVPDDRPKPNRCPYCSKTDKIVTKMSSKGIVKDIDSMFGE